MFRLILLGITNAGSATFAPQDTQSGSSAASDVYKRQYVTGESKANLSPSAFFLLLGKVRTGHMRWMHALVRVLFISQKQIVAVGKSEVTTAREQRTLTHLPEIGVT